jgi:hypothetical protein
VERCRHLCRLLFADEELLSVAIEAHTRGAFAGLNSIGHKNGNRGPAIVVCRNQGVGGSEIES